MQRLILVAITTLVVVLAAVSCAPSASPTTTTPAATEPSSTITWNDAKNHIGERDTVCGPVVSATWASGSKGQPTFLNIGKPYPDQGRFTVVIWIQNRSKFSEPPENYYSGKTICVTGLITSYKGVPQIEVKSPSEIQVR